MNKSKTGELGQAGVHYLSQLADIGLAHLEEQIRQGKRPFIDIASQEHLNEFDNETPVETTGQVTTVNAIEEYLEDRKLRGRSRYTINNDYGLFLKRFFRGYSIVPTDPRLIRRMLASYKTNTARTYWLYLSAFYNFLEWEHDVPNPMPKVPKPGATRTLPDHLNPEQRGLLDKVALTPRDRAIIEVFAETAVRPGEVADTRGHPLRFCDVYEDHIEVAGKRGERFVPISPELRLTLLSLQDSRPADSAVFVDKKGQALTTWGLRKVVRRGFMAAGITAVKPCPYTLRHSFGGEYLANGGDLATLQLILGHSKISTTMIYTHIANTVVVDAYRRHGPRANNCQV